MKRYLPKNAEDASALILTLLVIVLLSAIVTSFLSSSRTEETATRNYTSKTRAEQFASSATQQAMAKIQQGFTVNGTGTTVITTQPGAITQFVFTNGNITSPTPVISGNAITYPPTASLFSGTGNASTNGTANLNNLQSPSSNATLTSNSTNNRWTITGNASEKINVYMENVNGTVNGINQTVGRIAYYVDDEGSKLNLNAATGDRPTLNVGSSRSLSLSAFVSANQATNFTQTINGTTNTPTAIQTWAHFFRPEQLAGLFGGDAAISGNLSKFSTAPIVGSDYHLKKTPWGTDRLFINDLPLDETGVNAIYEALSGKNATTLVASPSPNQYELTGQKLRDIYGTTFAEKYTDEGLKQIAANILQARDPDTLNDSNKSFTYNGSLIGAEAEATDTTTGLVAIADCCNAVKKVIPKDYMGVAPYPFINELGVTVVWTCEYSGGNFYCRLNIRPFISLVNLNRTYMGAEKVDDWEIEMQIDSFQYDVTYNDGSTVTYGPSGFEDGDAWGHTSTESSSNARNRDSNRGGAIIREEYLGGYGPLSYRLSGFSNIGGSIYTTAANRAPDWGGGMVWSEEWQFPCPPYPNTNWNSCAQIKIPQSSVDAGLQIDSIDNIRIKFEYIRLIAKSGDGSTIRDWVLAEDTGDIMCSLVAPHPFDASKYPDGWPIDLNNQMLRAGFPGTGKKTNPLQRNQTPPPALSIKRIDGRLRTSATIADTGSQRDYMKPWSSQGAASWINASASEKYTIGYAANNYNGVAYPSTTFNYKIPGDPTWSETRLFFAYDPGWTHLDDIDWPSIKFTNPADLNADGNAKGVFTCPADLGKIQTNVQHRKLRMTTQHPLEVMPEFGGVGNATFIPDWAMLDVVSFGSNVTAVPAPAPINLNGKFHVPPSSPVPAPRTAGIESLLKTLDTSSQIGNPFNPTITSSVPTTGDGNYHDASSGLSATLVANIGNQSWTSGNGKFNIASYVSTWGHDSNGILANPPNSRRAEMGMPSDQFVLPAEVTEIRGISDYRKFSAPEKTNLKSNEGRLSAFFPGATTQSRFFTIYAFAQALDRQGLPDSEAVTKTLVEVVEDTSTTPSTYTVIKLYTQKIAAD